MLDTDAARTGGRDACPQRDEPGGPNLKQRSRSTKPQQTASGISRRSFLKSTGAGLAGAASVTALRPRISVAAPVTLSIWTGFPEIEQFYKKAGEEYAKKNPGFKLETLSSELRGMEQKIAAAVPTDTGPDLFDVSRNIALTLIDANLLPPDPPKVMSLLKSNAFHPVTVEYNTWKGQVYGVPFLEGSKPALYYNTKMFKEAGLDPNKPPETWTQMREYAQKLTKRDASGKVTQWGVQIPSSGFPYWLFQGLAIENGAQLMNPAGTQTFYDTPEVIGALQYWLDLINKYKVHPEGIVEWGTTPKDFFEKKVAMIWTTTGNLTNVKSNAKFDFGVS